VSLLPNFIAYDDTVRDKAVSTDE
jgi:hypothetical protein